MRRGEALLAGLLRCGHCGRKLHVAYSGAKGRAGRYHCRGGHLNHGGDRCISFGGLRIDRAIGAEVIDLQPLGVEAAIGALETRCVARSEKRRQIELASSRRAMPPVRGGSTMPSTLTTASSRRNLSDAGTRASPGRARVGG